MPATGTHTGNFYPPSIYPLLHFSIAGLKGQISPSRLFALFDFVIRHCVRPLSHPSAVSVPRLAAEEDRLHLEHPLPAAEAVLLALPPAWQAFA